MTSASNYKHNYSKVLFIIFLYFFTIVDCNAQVSWNNKKNSLFIELTTKKPYYFLNYERIILFRQKVRYSYRAGFAYVNDELYIPFGLSAITGSRKDHLELDLVCTP